MSQRRSRPITLLGVAVGLGVGLLLLTAGVVASLRPLGDVLAALVVTATVFTAGWNGSRDGGALLSICVTTLVAGGHLLGTRLRDVQAPRFPPTRPEYYVLVVSLALCVGFGVHVVGRWLSPATDG